MIKQLLISSGLFFSAIQLNAQQLPTNDFETWTGTGKDIRPVSWEQLNHTIGSVLGAFVAQTCFKETTNPHAGAACIKLVTVNSPQGPANGIATTGTINTTSQGVDGGQAFTGHPDSLVGYYKYTPVGTDKATFEIVLKPANNTDTIAWARFVSPNAAVSSWTRFSAPLIYRNSNPIANEVCLLSSSDGHNAVVGSVVWVDDVQLIYNTTSIKENSISNVNIFSSQKQIVVDLFHYTQETTLEVYNVNGQLVKSSNLVASQINEINLPQLSTGVYIYKLKSESGMKTGKLFIN